MCETIYGGKVLHFFFFFSLFNYIFFYEKKIDNDYDQKILQSLVNQYFNPQCFDINYKLFSCKNEKEAFHMPDAIK